MNQHQILTGGVNLGDHCHSIGSVEGVNFTAYAAGCDIVILAKNFERVQIIPGATHGNIQVSSVTCSVDTGKIAAAYETDVLIFEPTPLLQHNSEHKLDYQWYQTAVVKIDSTVSSVSWNPDGSRLLTASRAIQLWQPTQRSDEGQRLSRQKSSGGQRSSGGTTKFGLDDSEDEEDQSRATRPGRWECIWEYETAVPATNIQFSPDGLLFASVGQFDRMIKIWYECDLGGGGESESGGSSNHTVDYNFCYLPHPDIVTGFGWREISKYMPRGTVTNVILSWCKDNVCRLWNETVFPNDGLVDVQHFDVKALDEAKSAAHGQKGRIFHKLNNVRHAMHRSRRSEKKPLTSATDSMPSFHKYWLHQNGLTPIIHFHLAAIINIADIPLSLPYDDNFSVYWLNNKVMQFTLQSECLMHELNLDSTHLATVPSDKTSSTDDDSNRGTGDSHSSAETSDIKSEIETELSKSENRMELFDQKIEMMLKQWHQSADVLFAIHPSDGSILFWSVEWLDEFEPSSFRQVQVTFTSRIPNAMPVGDASSLSKNTCVFSNICLTDIQQVCEERVIPPTTPSTEPHMNSAHSSSSNWSRASTSLSAPPVSVETPALPNIRMLTKHRNGNLNLWQVSFAEGSRFSMVESMVHVSRTCGHRFRTTAAACHPVLPLLITCSHQQRSAKDEEEGNEGEAVKEFNPAVDYSSELILWRVDPVGPLGKSGGITELAKVMSPSGGAFTKVAWLPTLLPGSVLGENCTSLSSLFVASEGESLTLYQAVVDAQSFLTEVYMQNFRDELTASSKSEWGSDEGDDSGSEQFAQGVPPQFDIISEQSASRPGCIIRLQDVVCEPHDWPNLHFLHAYQYQLLTHEKPSHLGAFVDLRHTDRFEERFVLVTVEKGAGRDADINTWVISISAGQKDVAPSKGTEGEAAVIFSGGLTVETNKICGQTLDLRGASLVHAVPSAGHLSSSTIYPACSAPYLLATAASDGFIRYWQCIVGEDGEEEGKSKGEWKEWTMLGGTPSAVHIKGSPIMICSAYTGRIAIAYKREDTKLSTSRDLLSPQSPRTTGVRRRRPSPAPSNKQTLTLYVAIYEYASTGGVEWMLEDTVELTNIAIPDPKAKIDLNCILGNERKISHVRSSENFFKKQLGGGGGPGVSHHGLFRHDSAGMDQGSGVGKPEVQPTIPSASTIHSVKKSMADKGLSQSGVLVQKHLLQLDWAPTEDGDHILTVAVGSSVLFYSLSNRNISQLENSLPGNVDGKVTPFHSPMSAVDGGASDIGDLKWLRIRCIELASADGLPPLPMHVSWAKEGTLIVGMDNEMHVYSQWCGPRLYHNFPLEEEDLMRSDKASKLPTLSMPPANHSQGSSGGGLSPSATSAAFQSAGPPLNRPISTLRISQSVPQFQNMAAGAGGRKESRKEGRKGYDRKSERRGGGGADFFRKEEDNDSMEGTKDPSALSAILQECGLFEAAKMTNPVLPQFHPRQLLELVNFGKVLRVKAILSHLLSCISSSVNEDVEDVYLRSRTMSIVNRGEGDIKVKQEIITQVEIASIPPLTLHALLAADKPTFTHPPEEREALDFSSSPSSPLDDSFLAGPSVRFDLDDDPPPSRDRRGSSVGGMMGFGPKQSEKLSSCLTKTRLPGLSNLDQTYLMALSHTVANTSTDLASHAQANNDSQSSDVDDCGLRYIIAARRNIYLTSHMVDSRSAKAHSGGLPLSDIIWGYHSESEQQILDIIPCYNTEDPTWEELSEYGVGWLVQSKPMLIKLFETLGKAAFQRDKDPMDCAIYYLTLRKKALMWGLYRSLNDERMMVFFKNDFKQERWRKAALKNAYALLGKQRFTQAASFFLLADAPKDAIEVILNKVEDVQLAIVVAKIYCNDQNQMLHKIYEQDILKGINSKFTTPFARSMALWSLARYEDALSTLLEAAPQGGHTSPQGGHSSAQRTNRKTKNDVTSVFNFYNYLRTHPLLIRQKALKMDKDRMLAPDTEKASSEMNTAEQRLFFQVAHMHMKVGCPLLALEVLSKLPKIKKLKLSGDDEESGGSGFVPAIEVTAPKVTQQSDSMDWGFSGGDGLSSGLPMTLDDEEDDGPPTFSVYSSGDDDDEDEDEDEDEDDSEDEKKAAASFGADSIDNGNRPSGANVNTATGATTGANTNTAVKAEEEEEESGVMTSYDLVLQQLKFVACLKIAMEELRTLATGYEISGGMLRCQLYKWLEKEVEVLSAICSYSSHAPRQSDAAADDSIEEHASLGADILEGRSALSAMDAEDSSTVEGNTSGSSTSGIGYRLRYLASRRRWLNGNQHLLRTLLSYCSLFGVGGGGLASIRMELMLLLNELQQEKPQKQLDTPIPFPSNLPLISASLNTSQSVITDPISHLSNLAQDLLKSITALRKPPNFNYKVREIITMRDISVSLSACVYECLCDGDTTGNLETGESPNRTVLYKDSLLMAASTSGRRNSILLATSASDDQLPTSVPSQWPGVSGATILLTKSKTQNLPRLHILLVETLFSTYSSLLAHALTFYDCSMLYRLMAHRFTKDLWGILFGGGVTQKVSEPSSNAGGGSTRSQPKDIRGQSPAEQRRIHLHKQLLQQNTPPGGSPGTLGGISPPGKPRPPGASTRERFIPPKTSIINYYLSKPQSSYEYGYDSEGEEGNEDEDEEDLDEEESKRREQYMDPNSYTWQLIRLAVVEHVLYSMKQFLSVIGMDLAELPSMSPLLKSLLKSLEGWHAALSEGLDAYRGAPSKLLPYTIYGDTYEGDIGIPDKWRQLLTNPDNTPFGDLGGSALPSKRIWCFLTRRDHLAELFLKYLVRRPEKVTLVGTDRDRDRPDVKIIYQDAVTVNSFCFKEQAWQVAAATSKEVLEVDIGRLLRKPSWLEELAQNAGGDSRHQHKGKHGESGGGQEQADFTFINMVMGEDDGGKEKDDIPSYHGYQAGQGSTLTFKRDDIDIRKLRSHDYLPYYCAGAADGSVSVYEWGMPTRMQTIRQPALHPKVAQMRFDGHRNKLGVMDSEGTFSLWQFGMTQIDMAPYLSLQCHNKSASDFVLIHSGSFFASAGHSSDNCNICLWDSLMPQKTALIQGFTCHEGGSSCLVYAPQHQLLISSGKKGTVSVIDLRQRTELHSFQAHESGVTALALCPYEENFYTGSSDGEIKMWSLSRHRQLRHLPRAHSKASMFGKAMGVLEIQTRPDNVMYSCGADGFLKLWQWRQGPL